MKNIVGLDLGTNSIGWAVVNGSVNDDGSEQLVKIRKLLEVASYLRLPGKRRGVPADVGGLGHPRQIMLLRGSSRDLGQRVECASESAS